MSRLLLRPISYRHVVFPDRDRGSKAPVNFTSVGPVAATGAAASDEHLSADEYDCLESLFQQAGLDIDDYRFETIKRRIPACIRALRVGSLSAVRAAVQAQPELLKTVLGTLVIGVTGFFRDPAVFDVLAQSVVPRLLSQKNGPRIWSAGCSDGPELYSVAMLVAERGGLQRSTLLGSDCRPDALARAREGRYEPCALKNLPQAFLPRYFQAEGVEWRVHPYLRAITQWRAGNALTTQEPGAWNLILCRNMSIYLQSGAAVRLWGLLENCLAPGGYLVLGKAERPHGCTGLTQVAPCVYRRHRS